MKFRAQKSARRAGKRAVAGDGAIDPRARISLTAYYIAEHRGFEPGHELDDWLAAEAAIARAEQQPRVTKPIQTTRAAAVCSVPMSKQ